MKIHIRPAMVILAFAVLALAPPTQTRGEPDETSPSSLILAEGIQPIYLGLGGTNVRTTDPWQPRIYPADANGKAIRKDPPTQPRFLRPNSSLAQRTVGPREVAEYHQGVDISTRPPGAKTSVSMPFQAGVYGTVETARRGMITVRLRNGNLIEYHHVTGPAADITAGSAVEPATVLGNSGSVGTAQVHLHIQARARVQDGGFLIDPDVAFRQGQFQAQIISDSERLRLPAKPITRNGVVQVSESIRAAREFQGVQPWTRRIDLGGTAVAPNVGAFRERQQRERTAATAPKGGKVTSKTATAPPSAGIVTAPSPTTRGQRLQGQLQMPRPVWGGGIDGETPLPSDRGHLFEPLRSGAGITFGNPARSDLRPLRAAFHETDEGPVLNVYVAGREDPLEYGPIETTEWWTAYQFIWPSEAIRKLGATAADVGLVSMTSTDWTGLGTWTFAIHPSIANTVVARDAMRLDMLFGLNDPLMPRLPRGWVTYQWFDAPSAIVAVKGRLAVEPLAGPKSTVLRVQSWNKDGPVKGDNAGVAANVHAVFNAAQRLDRFARAVALLGWLSGAGIQPTWPATTQPEHFNVPNFWYLDQILQNTDDTVRGWRKKNSAPLRHLVRLEEGRTYVIDLMSNAFDVVLELEDVNGTRLASAQDSGGYPNARLAFQPTRTDAYRLVVNAVKPEANGAYAARLRYETIPTATQEVGTGLDLSGELTAEDGRDALRLASVCRIYPVSLHAGRAYRIDLTSNAFDAFLRLEDASRKTLVYDDDGGGFPNARIVYRPTIDGYFRIVATSFDGRVGPFRLFVREE